MKWTSEAPTTPGWYWFGDTIGDGECVEVTRGDDGGLYVASVDLASLYPIDRLVGDWAAIPRPEP